MALNRWRNPGIWSARVLLGFVPGLAWGMCGFPRLGILFGALLCGMWIFAWPFAIPLHLVFWALSVDLFRKRDAGELWDSQA